MNREMNQSIMVVGASEWLERMQKTRDHCPMLYAMYSTVSECIVTDPAAMMVPVDDHMVHRGDGVFESFKCLHGNIYNLSDHLERLERSCKAVGLELRWSHQQISEMILQTVRAGKQQDALIRLLVSRGQGTMGVNPYECLGTEIYIVVYELKKSGIRPMSKGVRMAVSEVPMKPGLFATVKTCNYLPNVLMKREAIDRGLDYMVSVDEHGNLGESATENVGIVTADRELLMPPPERVLAGTTAKRALLLAQTLVEKGLLTSAVYRPVPLVAARNAAEIHVYGTTPNVTPVIEFDGVPVGGGTAGPVAQALYDLLIEDMVPDSRRITPVFSFGGSDVVDGH